MRGERDVHEEQVAFLLRFRAFRRKMNFGPHHVGQRAAAYLALRQALASPRTTGGRHSLTERPALTVPPKSVRAHDML